MPSPKVTQSWGGWKYPVVSERIFFFFFFFNNPVFINKLRDNETRPLKGRGQHENQKLG